MALMVERRTGRANSTAESASIRHRAQLEEIHREHGVEMQRFLIGLRLHLDAQQLEDALQEVYLRLLTQLHAGRGAIARYDARRGTQRAYVLGVLRHVAIDRIRG